MLWASDLPAKITNTDFMEYIGGSSSSFNIQGEGLKIDGRPVESGMHTIRHGQVISCGADHSLSIM